MFSKKLAADLALVVAVFLATAGLVEAQRTYHGYLDPAFINYQLRSQTLKTRISEAAKAGNLKSEIADGLLSKLKQISDNAPQNSEGQTNARLNAQLDKLSSEIDLAMLGRTTLSGNIADIVAKKAQIRQLLSFSVSPLQKALFEKKLSRISAFEAYLLTSNGGLTYWQHQKIVADLDLLASQLSSGVQKISLLKN